MYDQLHDIPYTLVRARLLDARRERLAIEEARRAPNFWATLRLHLADRLGDILIASGARLKHRPQTTTDLAHGWVWTDHK